MTNQPFSLKDCAVLAAASLVLTVILIGCGGGTSASDKMESMRVIKRIQQSCIMYSQANNNYYPGRTMDGKLASALSASPTHYGAAAPSNSDQSIVYAILLNGEFLQREELVVPGESGKKTPAPERSAGHTVTNANYSFALLQFGQIPGNEGRLLEWKETANSQAPVVADRSKAIDPTLKTTSIHTGDSSGAAAEWKGNIGWNDNHVTFEESAEFEPGRLKLGMSGNQKADDIFNATDGNAPEDNVMFAY